MKRPTRSPRQTEQPPKHAMASAVPIRKHLLMEGQLMTHGTRGKEGRGPRGNKKY